MYQRGKTPDSASRANRVVIGKVNVKAHGFERMHVGIYEGRIPTPSFTVSTEPDISDQLSAKLERSDDSGDYSLEYFLQNFSDQDCEVTVWSGGGSGNSDLA